MNKQELRQQILIRRQGLPAEEIERASRLICQKIASLPPWKQAKTVMLYFPVRGEVDVRPLIERAWWENKTVAVPYTVPENKHLIPAVVHSFADLVPGAYGIPAPRQPFPTLSPESIDVVVVPGVAYDREGYRLGYGGGYYDRFLAVLRSTCYTVAPAYRWQVVEKIPRTEQDMPVDEIVTD